MISVKHAPMSSHELYERLLRDYHLQMEMLAGLCPGNDDGRGYAGRVGQIAGCIACN